MRQVTFRYASTISINTYIKMSTNFVPFKTIKGYIMAYINNSMNKSIIIENILGNIFLFAPAGILLPCIFKRVRKLRSFTITLLLVLLCIEMGQVITGTGSGDIDDVILNLTGAVLVFGIWKLSLVQKILRKMYIL
jgi:glycopeptide antibiotics resistance protein